MSTLRGAARAAAVRKRPGRRLVVLGGGLVTVLAVFFATSLPAFSAESGTVSATVTPLGACITLDKTSYDWGLAPFTQPGTGNSFTGPTVTATNCGSTAEKLYGRATDATNAGQSVTWTLDGSGALPCTLGTNKFQLSAASSDNSWGIWLSKVDQQLGSTLGASTSSTFTNSLRMPCTGSGGGGGSMSWQFVYTATLP